MHAIVTYLMSHDTAGAGGKKGDVVAVVESMAGGFDVRMLRDVLVSRLLLLRRGEMQHQGQGHAQRDVEKRVRSGLDRVRILRVFDLEGMSEALDEIEGLVGKAECPGVRKGKGKERERERERERKREIVVVADSEGEDEEEEDEDDEINEEKEEERTKGADGLGMVVIDTITNLVLAGMNDSLVHGRLSPAHISLIIHIYIYVQSFPNGLGVRIIMVSLLRTVACIGHAQLISLMRRLTSLARENNICVLLINGVVGTRAPSSSSSSTSLIDQQQPQPNQKNSTAREENHVSMFSSTYGRPALGKSFMYCVDTHLFLSRMPRSREDAEMAFVGTTKVPNDGSRSWKEVGVCEVLTDRLAGRERRWGCFEFVSFLSFLFFLFLVVLKGLGMMWMLGCLS